MFSGLAGASAAFDWLHRIKRSRRRKSPAIRRSAAARNSVKNCGSAVESLESRLLLSAASPFEAHFDFGTGFSPQAAGYTEVISSTTYSSASGFGWQSGIIDSRDRGATAGDDLSRDFNFTRQGTFVVDLADGTYDVTLVMGDGQGFTRDNMGISFEGQLVDSVTSSGGSFAVNTYRVTVADGQLTLDLEDLGGSDPLVMINGMDIVEVDTTPADTAGPQVVSVIPGDTLAGSLDRFTLTFNEEIDPASLSLDQIYLGGTNGAFSALSVQMISATEMEIIFLPRTEAGSYTLTLLPGVTDLAGNVMDQDGDGTGGEAQDDQFTTTVTLTPSRPFEAHFDFGTVISPAASGYTQVASKTIYRSARGFGWSDGTVDSRDRGSTAGDELYRDFNFTSQATFSVDVAFSGTYEITLVMGDGAGFTRDDMGIFAEGEFVDSVTSIGSSFAVNTYMVTVTDGRLNLTFRDLGGSDALVVINGLDVVYVLGSGEEPVNAPPVADAGGSYTVSEGGSVQLDASGSSDPNQDVSTLQYAWDLDGDGIFGETGADALYGSETGINPTFNAAALDGTSTFTVALRVFDDEGLMSEDTATVTVENVAPVITGLSLDSSVIDENGIVTLSLNFDDLGALDTHQIVVDWGDDSGAQVIDLSGGERSFSISHQYLDDGANPGGSSSQQYGISVSVTDDDGGTTEAQTTVTVNNVDPAIWSSENGFAASESFGMQGDVFSVSMNFSDVGSLDTHTAVIDWGDGTTTAADISESGGLGNLAGSHVYESGGIYTVTITLSDDDTGSAVTTMTHVVSGVGLHDGVLQIVGTEGNDRVFVTRIRNGLYKVRTNFLSGWQTFAVADVQMIHAALFGGNDRVSIAGNVRADTILDGGAGNDVLKGGGGSDVLIGGEGNDRLYGGKGRDILIGGAGRDRLVGGRGQDILIGGSTVFDTGGFGGMMADVEAFSAIQQEWNSDHDLQTRIANLTDGSGSAIRHNDGFFLKLNETVNDDGARDRISGGRGDDWFLLFAGDRGGGCRSFKLRGRGR